MNQSETPKEDFFCSNPVKNRYITIKTLMLDRGFKNIQDLASELGISRPLLSRIMHNHIQPTTALKLRIAKILKSDTCLIFGDGSND